MKIAVLGTGMVGTTIANKLIALGHEVRMGAREATNEKAKAWSEASGERASHGTFADAAAFGELVFNCTAGTGSLAALEAAGKENLKGKVLVDLANPLDFSKGMPPTLFIDSTDSLGERIQKAFPEAKVVKTLNTVNCEVMVDPARVAGGDHHMFLSGNDADAKRRVETLLREGFGWKHVVDLGDITTARGTESYLMLWVRLWGALKTADFNVKLMGVQTRGTLPGAAHARSAKALDNYDVPQQFMVVVESAPPNLGELESRVLGVLWESRAPLSVREVGAALEVTAELGGRAALAYTTVMTVLDRLHDKGLVGRTKQGRAFSYRPLVGREELFAERAAAALSPNGPPPNAVLNAFLDSVQSRDPSVLDRLAKLIEAKRGAR